MRAYTHLFFLLAAAALSVPSLSYGAPATGPATPCIQATTACEQWVMYGNGPARSMVYSTFPLKMYNPHIKRAFILIHGALRNADHYFRTATAAAFLAGALDDTIVIAPHFIYSRDPRQKNEVVWPSGWNNWKFGGTSPSNPNLASYDFIDQLQRMLANKKVFPNLKKIVIAGHSAGGQYVTRYEMANKVDGKLGVTTYYVVANPSTYAWPAAVRPRPVEAAEPVGAFKEPLVYGNRVNTNFKYGKYWYASEVPQYNKWPMGLDDLKGYVSTMTADQLRKQLVQRSPRTFYLLSEVDVLPLGGFDSRPVAMAQGPTRRARGEAFVNYVHKNMGGQGKVVIVSECDHNDRCVFTSAQVLPIIFPK